MEQLNKLMMQIIGEALMCDGFKEPFVDLITPFKIQEQEQMVYYMVKVLDFLPQRIYN